MLIPLNNFQQLPKTLTLGLCHGKDVALLNTCFDILVSHYNNPKIEWETYIIDSNANEFTLDLAARSLFTNKRFIKLIILPNQLSDKIIIFLQQTLENFDNLEQISLLIKLYPQNKKFTMSKWYKKFTNAGIILLAEAKHKNALLGFLQLRQAALNLQLSYQQLDSLVTLFEEDYFSIENSLQLMALSENPTYADNNSNESYYAQQNSFTLIDTILKNDFNTTLNTLKKLYNNGEELQLLIWAIAYPIRQIYQLQFAISYGESFYSAARQLNIWESRIPFYNKHVQRLSKNYLSKMITSLNRADILYKNSSAAEAMLQLEKILTSFFNVEFILA